MSWFKNKRVSRPALARAERPRGIAAEWVLLALALWWLPVANWRFLNTAFETGTAGSQQSSWAFGLALAVAVAAIHFIVLGLLAWGRLLKPVAMVLMVVAVIAAYYINRYGAYLDPGMIRNALVTHWSEASELLGWPLVLALLWGAVLPALLLWRLPIKRRAWHQALGWRLVALCLGVVALVAALLSAYQPLASLMRNNKELRYLITPANVMWSGVAVWRDARRLPAGPPAPVGRDAKLGASYAAAGPAASASAGAGAASTSASAAAQSNPKPRLLVLVVGETARAANWGLNGYARNTTPLLAERIAAAAAAGKQGAGPIAFTDVTSCGTDTETSLPCMFSAIGRRDYDERRIRGSENLLHVLATAGVGVQWRDNQSGCKGLCDAFPNTHVHELLKADATATAQLCSSSAKGLSCFDMGLLHGLPQSLPTLKGPQVLVLHQLGNHGPSYYRRVPKEFVRFTPACEFDDLQKCSTEQIVNAYDNALLYTDHVLHQLIAQLEAMQGSVDSAVLYLSDHGESLGEHRLFLHGAPYAIAPDVQKKVPMLMWFSPGFAQTRGLDVPCLAAKAKKSTSHDHLFHTVLGLMDVNTQAKDAAWDLSHGCTAAPSKP